MSEFEAAEQIIGKWRSDPDDPEAIATYGDVSLDFTRNGGLVYTIHVEGKREIMLLTYRIDGDLLITDQPSSPREERTRFKITCAGKLVLHNERGPSTYVRIGDVAALPSMNVSTN